MEVNDLTTNRRAFIGTLATGAVTMTLGAMASPLQSMAKESKRVGTDDDPDAWFKKIKGKHRIVFDVTEPHEILPFAWPRVFLMTNEATGSPAKDCGVVVVLRHSAIPYALDSAAWSKYKFGEFFNINDGGTKTASMRNAFWKPAAGAFKVPGVGEVAIGINELQDSGVMFCVCNVALTVNAALVAQGMNMKPEEVKKDWMDSLLPGIQVVPSGVWAVGRAQENGCAYCFAG
jgi:intracellular sulfur oxidation DsrE/DsrF family protein